MTSQNKRQENMKTKTKLFHFGLLLLAGAMALVCAVSSAQAADKKPNIVVIMGDDVGWSNIGVYNQGMMAGRTPNLDKLAKEGMRFTDYYAEASCTAGRANFITGQLPIRTGMTTVGQAGAKIGLPAAAVTMATALKAQGYATGQFGKNHLGDRNEFLPTVHGFDEFFGYLYHLDAMEDPFHPGYPPQALKTVGPRNIIHTWATDTDDPTEQPRWGKIGKQKIEDDGPLPPHPMQGIKYNMETVDDAFLAASITFMDKARAANHPFFLWLNPTRMHVLTHLSPKYEAMRTPENNWTIYEAGMAQLDDNVGSVMQYLKDAGNPNISDQLLKGVKLGDRTYKNHLDGYDQIAAITGKGPSARHEILYFAESTLGAVRLDDFKYRFVDQPNGWFGGTVKPSWPILVNLREDPYERSGLTESIDYYNWFAFEFWRFVYVQQQLGKEAQTFIDYPPMQMGASFNLSALKAELQKKMEEAKSHGQGD